MSIEKDIYFLSELDRYSLTPRQARALIQEGRLPAVKVGKKIRVRKIDLDNFFSSQAIGGLNK